MDNIKKGTVFMTTGTGKSGFLQQLLEKSPEQYLNVVKINFNDSNSKNDN